MSIILLAQHYRTVKDAILEAVQNALDEMASLITIVVDLEHREVSVSDDGHGKKRKEVEDEILKSVAISLKGPGQMGRFGVGFIAPIGKCRLHTFTTTPEGTDDYWEWSFSSEEIRRQRSEIVIPKKDHPEFRYGVPPKRPLSHLVYVLWRTQVKMYDVVQDSLIGVTTAHELEESIRDSFSAAMRKRKVLVRIECVGANGAREDRDIVAHKFEGRKLEAFRVKPKVDHEVMFRLFIAPKTTSGRRGTIEFGEYGDDYRISARQLQFPSSGLLSAGASHALISGIFEGEILSNRAKFNTDRKGFVQDDRFLELLMAIDEWFDKIGVNHVVEIQEDTRWERYQRVGQRSMGFLEGMLKDERWNDIYQSFSIGSIGKGHAPVDATVLGEEEDGFISIDGGAGKLHDQTRSGGDERVGGTSSKPNPQHRPHIVGGSGRQRRAMVENDSIGAALDFVEMPASPKRYALRDDRFFIEVNIRHPLFEECEGKETTLMKYVESLMCEALTVYRLRMGSPNVLDDALRGFDALSQTTVFHILYGDRLTERAGGRRPRLKRKDRP